ncbi:hypothetical protein ACSLBF_21325 (plasmid) [Pseudoalteromonas sp. T1lg65]|uniref:hypothetical protein n=1 Tax=Pseudoalteromonas sp. T1lg65 TaxID=2077101 RepID=UPI003F798BFE
MDKQPTVTTSSEPSFNKLGKIAESYSDIHKIHLLDAVRNEWTLETIGYDRAIREHYVGVEICLLHMTNRTEQARKKITFEQLDDAFVDIRWLKHLHLLLRSIGRSVQKLATYYGLPDSAKSIAIESSTALKEYLHANQHLESVLLKKVDSWDAETLNTIVGNSSHNDLHYSLLHLFRLMQNDAVKWEAELSNIPVSAVMPEFHVMVPFENLFEAVNTAQLNVDSYYGEFVCLHQIPEVFAAAANDYLEASIRSLRKEDLSTAFEQLDICNVFLENVVKCQAMLSECLTTAEYHLFRENLGVASGTHSIVIAQYLFKDLYKCFWRELEHWLGGPASMQQNIAALHHGRAENTDVWVAQRFINCAFELHNFYEEWRHQHLNLVKNVLGSGGTKSKIGMPDALKAVYSMREKANHDPALCRLYEARGLSMTTYHIQGCIFQTNASPTSVTSRLDALTGLIARDRFQSVQSYSYCPHKPKAQTRTP